MRPIQRLAIVAALVVASAPTALAWESQDETPPETTLAPTPEAEVQISNLVIDGRRTTRKFFPNLGRNMVGMFSKETLAPLAIGTGATLLAAPFDDNVQRYFTSDGR